MKKDTKSLNEIKTELKTLTDIQPLTPSQATELKGGTLFCSCCTDKRRPTTTRIVQIY